MGINTQDVVSIKESKWSEGDWNHILCIYSHIISYTLALNITNFLNQNHVLNTLISPYRISPSRAINPVDFPYWDTNIYTGLWSCVQIYVTCDKLFSWFSLMSKIQVYVTVFQVHWYAVVTGSRHNLEGFPIYPRYRYLLTFTIGMYLFISILVPYPFWFDSLA